MRPAIRTSGMAEITMNPPDVSGDDDRHVPLPLRLSGAIAGLVAAFAALAVAELVAGTRRDLQSPVLDVGDRVVDAVPRPVKDLAIDWFGTKDKVALLAGIGTLLAIYALVVGAIAVGRRWRFAIVGVAAFGLIGAYASQTTRRATEWYAVLPSLIGGAVGAAVLVLLRRQLIRPMSHAETSDAPSDAPADAPADASTWPAHIDRRRFVIASGATAAGAVVLGATGRRLADRYDLGSQRASLTLPAADRPLAPPPADVQAAVDGVSPFFTPNGDFYRIDTALTVPRVSAQDWQLEIRGMVDRPFTLSYSDLLDRQIVESDITLTCVSNEVGGTLLGTARWLGVRLDDLLAEAGIDPAADQIVGRSVDGWTSGFPVTSLDGRDALLAIGMNGEPLPLEHGYPARLIVPGLYGYVSATKWIESIELTRFDAFDAYWVERDWSAEGVIKLQSRIDTPRGLSKVPAGRTAVAGVAWAQRRGIERVEVQIDDGDWVATTLAAEQNVDTWRQWSYAWDAPAGRHSIRVRAVERGIPGDAAIQTDERSEPFPSGATGQHQIIVIVE
jgi:DMSO/TMAO reductase YedYZ molybdopterin-dependent catalytic subunit